MHYIYISSLNSLLSPVIILGLWDWLSSLSSLLLISHSQLWHRVSSSFNNDPPTDVLLFISHWDEIREAKRLYVVFQSCVSHWLENIWARQKIYSIVKSWQKDIANFVHFWHMTYLCRCSCLFKWSRISFLGLLSLISHTHLIVMMFETTWYLLLGSLLPSLQISEVIINVELLII